MAKGGPPKQKTGPKPGTENEPTTPTARSS
jgi:hypothetical protein